jgi:hypothetical protein
MSAMTAGTRAAETPHELGLRRGVSAAALLHCRRLGLIGSAVLVLGGILVGVPPLQDPVLQQPVLRFLRTFTTPAVAVVFVGVCMLMLAWWRLGRLVRSDSGSAGLTTRELLVTLGWWSAPLLVTTPIFSRDVYSYLAQGSMTVFGVDAYQHGPQFVGGPLAVDIPQIWQTTPAPYGPVFLTVASDVTSITGLSKFPGILGMRILALAGLALVIISIPRIARAVGVEPNAALWLGVLNPLTIIHFVGDVHNDALMLGLMMAGLALALERRPALGAVLVTLAALVKAPAGLALVFIVPIWASQLGGRARWPRAGLAAAGIGVATVVGATTVAGTGYGWVAALDTPTLAHTWTSITTDVGYWSGVLAERLGLATADEMLALWRIAGLAAAGVICLLMLRRHRATPVVGLGLGLAAVLALGPVVHPWYLLWAMIPLAAAATSPRIRRAVVITTFAMTALVLPGGVQPTPDVFLGALLGAALVFGTAWAARNIDWSDVAGSFGSALRRSALVRSALGRATRGGSLGDVVQREPVAVNAQPADHPGRDRRHDRVVPERFTRVDVGDVHLDQRLR